MHHQTVSIGHLIPHLDYYFLQIGEIEFWIVLQINVVLQLRFRFHDYIQISMQIQWNLSSVTVLHTPRKQGREESCRALLVSGLEQIGRVPLAHPSWGKWGLPCLFWSWAPFACGIDSEHETVELSMSQMTPSQKQNKTTASSLLLFEPLTKKVLHLLPMISMESFTKRMIYCMVDFMMQRPWYVGLCLAFSFPINSILKFNGKENSRV